jgi:ABC-type phosphate/phosphonate transport system substrate-binding protein
MRPLSVIYALVLLAMLIGSNAPAQIPPGLENRAITLGAVSTINEKEIEDHFRDFVRYLARKLSPTGIEGKVVVAPTVPDLARLLEQKKVDFYLESAYPTYVVNNVHDGGRLLLRRWQRVKRNIKASFLLKRTRE